MMARVKYLCHYCGNRFETYIYSVEVISDNCTKCNSKMDIKNISMDNDTDVFGYKKKSKDETVKKGDAFHYNDKKTKV